MLRCKHTLAPALAVLMRILPTPPPPPPAPAYASSKQRVSESVPPPVPAALVAVAPAPPAPLKTLPYSGQASSDCEPPPVVPWPLLPLKSVVPPLPPPPPFAWIPPDHVDHGRFDDHRAAAASTSAAIAGITTRTPLAGSAVLQQSSPRSSSTHRRTVAVSHRRRRLSVRRMCPGPTSRPPAECSPRCRACQRIHGPPQSQSSRRRPPERDVVMAV